MTEARPRVAESTHRAENGRGNGRELSTGKKFKSPRNQQAPKRARGRPTGSQNRSTRILKEAVLLAAEAIGHPKLVEDKNKDGKVIGHHWEGTGNDALIGYLKWAALQHPRSYLAIMSRILPMQVTAKVQIDETLQVKYPSREEVVKELKRLGLNTSDRIYDMGEHEYEEVHADD